MDYIFKIDDGLKFSVKSGKNMSFGVTAGNSGSAILPDNVVTSNTIKHIEAVTRQWYDTNSKQKDTVYIINSEE